jgi:hypothetical protein
MQFVLFSALNSATRRNYGHGRKQKFPTMNDMPVPEGDYWALYAKRQRKYNSILAAGLTLSGSGLYIVSITRNSTNHSYSSSSFTAVDRYHCPFPLVTTRHL